MNMTSFIGALSTIAFASTLAQAQSTKGTLSGDAARPSRATDLLSERARPEVATTDLTRLLGPEAVSAFNDQQKVAAIANLMKGCPTCMQVWGGPRVDAVVVPGAVGGNVGTRPTISHFPKPAKAPECSILKPFYDTINEVCLSRDEIVKLATK